MPNLRVERSAITRLVDDVLGFMDFLGTGPATDYDRACDVQEPAAVLRAPPSGVLILRDAAGGAAWLPHCFRESYS